MHKQDTKYPSFGIDFNRLIVKSTYSNAAMRA